MIAGHGVSNLLRAGVANANEFRRLDRIALTGLKNESWHDPAASPRRTEKISAFLQGLQGDGIRRLRHSLGARLRR